MKPITPSRLLHWTRRLVRNDQLLLSLLALVVGAVSGGAVIGFREAISFVQFLGFGTGDERLYQHVLTVQPWLVVLVPTVGGLAVGILVKTVMPGGRPQGVADVIEASAINGGRMSINTGLAAAAVSALSIGAGASVGREGPAAHLGASLGGWMARRLHLTRPQARTLLGCGVASAVASSFNAPIAGALFANEVVIGHYALSAFAPTVIASVTGTALSRWWFGDFPAFTLGEHPIRSLLEFPAFIGLGIICGLVAMAMMKSTFTISDWARKVPVPEWVRPAVGGLIVGVIALIFPQVLGIGYGATETALLGGFALGALAGIAAAKILATAVSLGFGFGGGIFSPALVIGAMVGGAFGVLVTGVFPDLSSGPGAYTVVGMGAVAAAVLGAPISTALIVFEMTGDYQLTMALMVAVVVATVITRQFDVHSFFSSQLERRGLDLRGGFETQILRATSVGQVMEVGVATVPPGLSLHDVRICLQRSPVAELFVVNDGGTLVGTITLADLAEIAFDRDMDLLVNAGDVARRSPPVLAVDETLEDALKLIRNTGEAHIAVVEQAKTMTFRGLIHERDVMGAYNRALIEVRREERN